MHSLTLFCFITARKRSLGQGNIFAPVCHSVHGGVSQHAFRCYPSRPCRSPEGSPGPHLGGKLRGLAGGVSMPSHHKTSSDVQNKSVSGPTKRTYALKFFLKTQAQWYAKNPFCGGNFEVAKLFKYDYSKKRIHIISSVRSVKCDQQHPCFFLFWF